LKKKQVVLQSSRQKQTNVATPTLAGQPASPLGLMLELASADGRCRLSLPVELEGVAPQPAGTARTSLGLGELASFAQSSGGFSGGGKTAELPVLHDWPAHPVDLGVTSDGLVVDVDHDDLEVLVGGVLANPVRVEHTQSLESAADTLLGDGLQVPLWLLFLDGTRSLGLAIRTSLGDGALASSATHGNAVDHKALLVLVSQTAGLVRAGGPRSPVNLVELAVMPAPDAKQVTHDVTLLLAIHLRHVLVRAHLEDLVFGPSPTRMRTGKRAY